MKTNAATHRTRRGFTLIEMLTVISIIAVLAALLFPMIRRAIDMAQVTRMKNNGRQIATSMVSASMHEGLIGAVGEAWPRSESFASSTDFFRYSITNELIETDFSLFAGPGVPAYRGIDPERFNEENCAWSVVLDVSDATHDSTPVLITRNVSWTDGTLGGEVMMDPLERPFGDKYAVFVTRSGAAFDLRGRHITSTNMNAAAAMNRVLPPEFEGK